MVRNADPTKTAGKADWRRESLMRPESPLFPSPGTAMKENRRPQAVILSAAKDLFVAGAEEILRCAQDDGLRPSAPFHSSFSRGYASPGADENRATGLIRCFVQIVPFPGLFSEQYRARGQQREGPRCGPYELQFLDTRNRARSIRSVMRE